MRTIMLIIVCFFAKPLLAKDFNASYPAAEDAYRQGDFQQAVKIYLAAIEEGQESASLYYNLGTSLYKNGELGAAVAAHLRARSLNPGDPDIRYNLRFLLEKSRDKLDTRLTNDRWHEFSAAQWFSERALFWWAVIALALALVVAGWQLATGRALLLTWAAAALLFLFSVYPGLSLAHARWQEPDWGAVVVSEVDVLASPTIKNGVVIFQLHEGAPFAVVNESGEWFKIQLSDGKTGWIPREGVAIFGKNYFSYQVLKSESSPEKPAL